MKKLAIISISCGLLFATAFGATSAKWAVTDNAPEFGIKIATFHDAGVKKIFLDTGGSSLWDQAGATFTVHLWGGSESSSSDVKMTKVGDTSIYSAEVNANYSSLVFARIAKDKELDADWANVWNKSNDLSLPTDEKDLYTITGWGPNYGTDDEKKTCPGTWSVHTCLAGEPVVTSITSESCTEDGLNNEKTYCIFCGKLMSDEDIPVPKHHQMPLTHHEKVDETCTEPGVKEYYECEECNSKFSDSDGTLPIVDLVIPAKGHSLGGWEHDAENHFKICEHCSEHFEVAPHSGGTATEEHGKICEICGFEYTEPLAHEHSYIEHPAISATCTEAGNELYYTCSGCSLVFNASKVQIPDIPIIPATGHTKVTHVAVDPTCTTAGNSAYYECVECHKYYSDAAMTVEIAENSWNIAELGHSCGEDHYCTRCGELDPAYRAVTFIINYGTNYGENIYIAHGGFNSTNWTTTNWIPMQWTEGNNWKVTLVQPAGTTMLFKFVCRGGTDRWESDPNRSFTFTTSGDQTFYWR